MLSCSDPTLPARLPRVKKAPTKQLLLRSQIRPQPFLEQGYFVQHNFLNTLEIVIQSSLAALTLNFRSGLTVLVAGIKQTLEGKS